MLVTITRASDQSHICEYEDIEVESIAKDKIIERFGRCESGEIICVISEGKEVLRLGYSSQYRNYKEYTGDYYKLWK